MTAVLTAKRSGRRRMRWQIAPFSALICALSTLNPVDALASQSAAPSQAQAQAQQNHQQTAQSPAIPLAKELYSVAPMMGHSNRHYRHFIRLMGSHRAHLYTEMIPASQIVRAYNRARGIYFGDNGSGNNNEGINADEILDLVQRMKEDPSKEYQRLPGDMDDNLTLHQLVATSHSSGLAEHPVVLQLGGNDSAKLGMAAAIGAAYGEGEYSEINLNCGCPSNAVGGRAGGCALMKEPELVARCVESMNVGAQSVSSTRDGVSAPGITVKHRLGVRDAMTYDATTDRAKDDEEAFGEVSAFIKTVAQAGVKKSMSTRVWACWENSPNTTMTTTMVISTAVHAQRINGPSKACGFLEQMTTPSQRPRALEKLITSGSRNEQEEEPERQPSRTGRSHLFGTRSSIDWQTNSSSTSLFQTARLEVWMRSRPLLRRETELSVRW